MAFAAARCGADVVIASRDYDSCAGTASEIETATGRCAMPYRVHAGRWDELPGLVDAVYDRFGRLDALINNAGMSPVYDSLGSVTEKMFDSVLNVNLKGPFRLSVLAGERMMAGPFYTQAHADWDEETLAAGLRPHALQRAGQPPEVVGAALYLISDAASYTSSATLRVDGGIP